MPLLPPSLFSLPPPLLPGLTALGLLLSSEPAGKEISWQEFVTQVLESGEVERIIVSNRNVAKVYPLSSSFFPSSSYVVSLFPLPALLHVCFALARRESSMVSSSDQSGLPTPSLLSSLPSPPSFPLPGDPSQA